MQFALQNLVDSHDTDRLASMIVNRPQGDPYLQADRFDYDVSPRVSPRHGDAYDVSKPSETDRRLQRMVALLQMTYLGAPMVYYGDEAGMWGGDDPCDRSPMLWEDLQPYEPQASDPLNRPREPDELAVDQQLLAFYKRAIALRRGHDVFRHGSYATVETNDNAQFFAFRRELDGKSALVAFNRGEQEFVWQLPKSERGAEFQVALSTDADGDGRSRGNGPGGTLTLPPLSAVVLLER
jgi:glycosidase